MPDLCYAVTYIFCHHVDENKEVKFELIFEIDFELN